MDIKNTIRRALAFIANRITRGWLLLLRRYYLHYKYRISLDINGVYYYFHRWDPCFEDRLKHYGIAVTEEMYRTVSSVEVKRNKPLINVSWLFFQMKELNKVCYTDNISFILERERKTDSILVHGDLNTEINPDGAVIRLKKASTSPVQHTNMKDVTSVTPVQSKGITGAEETCCDTHLIRIKGAVIDYSF